MDFNSSTGPIRCTRLVCPKTLGWFYVNGGHDDYMASQRPLRDYDEYTGEKL